jgi:DNA-binding response OmpR family regulator
MKILVLSVDPELALLRQHVLRTAGHETLAPISDHQMEDATDNVDGAFDVAVLCHRLPDGRARELIRRFHRTNPQGRIVSVVHMYGEWPQIEADRYVVGTDGPEALVRVVSEIASERSAAVSNGN